MNHLTYKLSCGTFETWENTKAILITDTSHLCEHTYIMQGPARCIRGTLKMEAASKWRQPLKYSVTPHLSTNWTGSDSVCLSAVFVPSLIRVIFLNLPSLHRKQRNLPQWRSQQRSCWASGACMCGWDKTNLAAVTASGSLRIQVPAGFTSGPVTLRRRP